MAARMVRCSGAWRDVPFTPSTRNCVEARRLAEGMRLSTCFSYVYSMTKNIYLMQDLPPQVEEIDCLILDMASNDLANLRSIDYQGVCEMVDFYFNWARNCGARYTLILGVLKRTHRLAASPEVFNVNRKLYNSKMKARCVLHTHIYFEKLSGYETRINKTELPVSEWSIDGIHVDNIRGYRNKVAHAVMNFARRVGF